MTTKQLLYHPVIRRLWRLDQSAICAHFLRLDAETRRTRFNGAISDAALQGYAAGILSPDAMVCGGFVEGQLRAVAELRGVCRAWPSTAEAAFSVEAGWQNHGIGDALLTHVIALAQNRGIGTLHMICLRENERMRHLAEKHSASFAFGPGQVEAVLEQPWPSTVSLTREIASETRGMCHSILDTAFGLTWCGTGEADRTRP